MRKFRAASIIILLSGLLALSGCAEKIAKDIKHFQSDFVGLQRKVTLYSADGKIIKTWEGRFKVEVIGGTASFL